MNQDKAAAAAAVCVCNELNTKVAGGINYIHEKSD